MKFSLIAIGCLAGWLGAAENWPSWRGPEGTGSVAEGKVPLQFSEKEAAWKVELPGRGCSTPAVWDGKIFLTAPLEGKDAVLCFDLEGKELWSRAFGEQRQGRGQRVGSGANPSPLSDGKNVYVYFKSGTLAALDLEGKVKWEVNLQKDYEPDKLWWDLGTSPVLAGGNLVVAVMQTDGKSYLLALDPESGKEVWKKDRNFETAKESGDSYTTPHVVEIGGKAAVLSFGADHLTAHAAKDGALLWATGGLNPAGEGAWRTIASSVVADGVVVVPHGRGEFLAGYDIQTGKQLWREKISNTDAATPVARDGKVLILVDRGKDRGKVLLLEARTGKVLWEDSLPKGVGTYYSSPVWIGNNAVFPREDGVVVTAEIGPEGLGQITENQINETFIASPAVGGGLLLLRGDRVLWAVK